MPQTTDIVVAGGGAMGASMAYHLCAAPGFSGRVTVLEPDPTYARAASALSAASIRQQFSSPVNIRASLFGIDFLRRAGDILAVDGERPEIGLREGGYLFLATAAGRTVLTENHAVQTEMGADIALFDAGGVGQRFPWLSTDGIAAASWGRSGEGWFDGYSLLQAFRKKARALGAEFRKAAVVALDMAGSTCRGVVLEDGTTLACGQVAIAAGTGARALVRQTGFDIPVHAKKRMIFTFHCRDNLADFPLLIDSTGVYCRPEGTGYLCGSAPPADADPDADGDFEVDYRFFDDHVWPVLAARVPAFEAVKRGRAWAGHYDMNSFDHNALVGAVPGTSNVWLANGFSGHGLQQSPAVGNYLAELICGKTAATAIDLGDLAPKRLVEMRPIFEKNVV
jgi:glycine/D-amino acid oxidase-like deaminating enzyme